MKYKVGDKVRFKPLSWFKNNCAKVQNGYKYGEDTQVITKADLSTCGEVGVIEAVTSKGRYMTSLSVDVYPEWVFDFAEMEEIIIPFDIEKAKAGAKVVTEDGRNARIICFDRVQRRNYNLVVLVNTPHQESVYAYNSLGIPIDDEISGLNLKVIELRPKQKVTVTKQEIADKLGIDVSLLEIKE